MILLWFITISGCGEGGGSHSNPSIPSSKPATDWQASLKIAVADEAADGGEASNRLVAGTATTATDVFDNAYDIRAFLAGPVQAYFVHEDDARYEPDTQQLWHDIRAADLPKEWEIEVMAVHGRVVTLSWTLPTGEVRCGTHQFSFWDVNGQFGQTDMCMTGSVTYTGDGQVRHFVMRVS